MSQVDRKDDDSQGRLLDPVQRLTADRMIHSHLSTAHVTILGEAVCDGLVVCRHEIRRRSDRDSVNVTYTHLLVKILATALRKHPLVNARLVRQRVVHLEEVNIGVAFAGEDGRLFVPVYRRADEMSVRDIAEQSLVFQEKLVNGRLTPADMQDGTFTFTNLGTFPAVLWTTPLINPPQCAIMGTGTIHDKVVVAEGGKVTSRKVIGLSLTHDHRILNGLPAAAFVQEVADLIADPWCVESGL